jgi:hypothetical protein
MSCGVPEHGALVGRHTKTIAIFGAIVAALEIDESSERSIEVK